MGKTSAAARSVALATEIFLVIWVAVAAVVCDGAVVWIACVANVAVVAGVRDLVTELTIVASVVSGGFVACIELLVMVVANVFTIISIAVSVVLVVVLVTVVVNFGRACVGVAVVVDSVFEVTGLVRNDWCGVRCWCCLC